MAVKPCRNARPPTGPISPPQKKPASDGDRVAGALLFTCNGRGTNLFAAADHDARAVGELLGGDAIAGFFCAGEIGPVGGRPFLHGFTATLAVFLDD